ncbi:hypothetical protein SLA2020_278370 [Shorea laevis]
MPKLLGVFCVRSVAIIPSLVGILIEHHNCLVIQVGVSLGCFPVDLWRATLAILEKITLQLSMENSIMVHGCGVLGGVKNCRKSEDPKEWYLTCSCDG